MNASSSSAATLSGFAWGCRRGAGGAGFGELLRRTGFFLLELAAQVPFLLDSVAGAFGVSLELLRDRGEPRLVVGSHARPHVTRSRVRRVVEAREPGFVLAPLLQQALDDHGALGRPFGHATNLPTNRLAV